MFVKFLNPVTGSQEEQAIQSLLLKGAKLYLGDIGLMFPIRLPVHLFALYSSKIEKDIEIYKFHFTVMN